MRAHWCPQKRVLAVAVRRPGSGPRAATMQALGTCLGCSCSGPQAATQRCATPPASVCRWPPCTGGWPGRLLVLMPPAVRPCHASQPLTLPLPCRLPRTDGGQPLAALLPQRVERGGVAPAQRRRRAAHQRVPVAQVGFWTCGLGAQAPCRLARQAWAAAADAGTCRALAADADSGCAAALNGVPPALPNLPPHPQLAAGLWHCADCRPGRRCALPAGGALQRHHAGLHLAGQGEGSGRLAGSGTGLERGCSCPAFEDELLRNGMLGRVGRSTSHAPAHWPPAH